MFSLPSRTPSRSRLGIQIHRGTQFALLRGADTHLRKRRKERRKGVIRRGIRDGNRGHTAGRLQNGRCGRGPARSTGVAALRCLGARTSGGTVVEGRVVGRRRRGRELGGVRSVGRGIVVGGLLLFVLGRFLQLQGELVPDFSDLLTELEEVVFPKLQLHILHGKEQDGLLQIERVVWIGEFAFIVQNEPPERAG